LAGPTTARAGNQVMAGPGGSANIVYPDGCVVKVDPGTVVNVSESSPCNAGFVTNLAPFAVGAAIVGGAFAISTIDNENDNNNNNKPASP
jgi:hypothetical protein